MLAATTAPHVKSTFCLNGFSANIDTELLLDAAAEAR